jgi:hypothetical protein
VAATPFGSINRNSYSTLPFNGAAAVFQIDFISKKAGISRAGGR